MKQITRWIALLLLMVMALMPALARGEGAADTQDEMTVQEEAPLEPSEEDAESLEGADSAPADGPELTAPAEAAPPPFVPLAVTSKKDMPKPGTDVKSEAIVTAPEGIAMFELPTHESGILMNLDAGAILTLRVLGQTWSILSLGEEMGYVPTRALSFAYGSVQPNIAIVTAPGGKLTLRAEMTTKSKALATVPSGRAVLLLAKGKTFSLVRHENLEGYVLSEHLKEVPVNIQLGTLTRVVSIVPEREANVRLRAQPNRNAAEYTKVKSGNFVVVLEIQDGWALIEFDGYHGYMMAEYLKQGID
jgi:SH3-like domain-containing protein